MPATGIPVKSEQIYDVLGRVVATRYWANTAPEDWTCITYDARGRVTQVAYPAFFGQPARTVTTTYRAPFTPGGTDYDPFTTAVTDSAGTLRSTVDALGRAVSSTDVWGKTTTNVYNLNGTLASSSGPSSTRRATRPSSLTTTSTSPIGVGWREKAVRVMAP